MGWYCSGWKVCCKRLHRIGISAVPYSPGSTLPIYPSNAVQELVSVLTRSAAVQRFFSTPTVMIRSLSSGESVMGIPPLLGGCSILM